MKKIPLLLLILIGQCTLESCCNTEDECFDLELKSVVNFNLDGNKEANQLDTIKANNYEIKLESKTINQICFVDKSFGGTIYAFSCDDPFYLLQNKITNVSIISSQDLNSNFTAGSELKTLFRPIELDIHCHDQNKNCLRDYSQFERIDSIEDAINQIMAVNFYLEETKNLDLELFNLFSLKIEESIDESNHEFSLKFTFENGNVVELNTEEVILN